MPGPEEVIPGWPDPRAVFLALIDERADWLLRRVDEAERRGYQRGHAAGYDQGAADERDAWCAGLDDIKADMRLRRNVPGYADLIRLRHGPPWWRGEIPEHLNPEQRRRWLARHPAWRDKRARAAWEARQQTGGGEAYAVARAAELRDADDHERAFVARAYNTAPRDRTDPQRGAARMYPPPAGKAVDRAAR